MLSLWKLRVGAEAYYLGQVARGLDDYYIGGSETRGRWIGNGAGLLDLADDVTSDDLRAVLAGLAPGTALSPNGTQIRTWKGRVPGFDLTFSAPKSVSVMYAFGDVLTRNDIVEAIDCAVGEAMGWLEREACFVRRGSNNRDAKIAPFEQWGTRRVRAAGFIAAGFNHRTSRAGDPQLHTHVLVANLAKGPDGRWSALDGQALYRSKIAAGTVFQTALRNELSSRLGVEWLPVTGGVADIAGIPRRVLTHFSKRRNEIETELERTGRSGAAAAADATLATRTTKLDIDQDTLDETWRDDGATIDYGCDDIDQLLTNARPIPAAAVLRADSTVAIRPSTRGRPCDRVEEVSIEEFASMVAYGLPERDATITRHEVQNAVAEQLSEHNDTALLERLTDAVLAHRELVPLPTATSAEAGWEQLWTTRRLLSLEAELTQLFQPTPDPTRALDPIFVDTTLAALNRPLGTDQADTVRRVCTQGLGVEVVVGRAGSGKTYTMRTVREIYQAAGRRLVGVCPTARAARELADGAGIESFTIPRFNMHAHLDANTIVVVDEAAMCATVDLHQIVTRAHATGAKVILVGDHHQLPEIGAGGGFRAALDALGNRACELTINRRQHHQWEHFALNHLRSGDVAAFWNTYTEHDRVVLADTATDIRNRAVADWWDSHTAGGSAYLLAGTRTEAKLLNTLARRHASEAGHLTGATLDLRGRPLQVGDRIVLLRNMGGQLDVDTGARCRVDNGMIATITHINHHSSDINIELANGRHLQLTGDYVQAGCIDHGYATTIHKAQGLTCDDIYVVGPAGLYRESGYVALSRARNTAHLYATTRDAANIAEPTHTTGIPLPTENVDDPEHDLINALTHSHAKQFALTTCPDLDVIADTANNFDLGQLTQRQRHINSAIHSLRTQGLADPHTALERLRLAADHRQFMHVGGRVNALDWDNVGTIKHLHDSTGHATVAFTTSDGQHTNTKTLPWEQLKPIDHPVPSELTDLAERFFTEFSERINHDLATWNDALADYGINAGEPQVIPSAIAQRERKLFYQLRATPPDWLIWWAGSRPTDPTAAVVYDDHIRTLATWRDQHQLPDHTPGYGPLPDNPDLADQWRQLMDTALATRHWLTQRGSTTPETPAPISIADARQRLFELDELFAQAPADQRKIVDDLLADPNMDIADKIDALQHAGAHQTARQDWILEHWPNVIEHHELTTIVDNAGPLGHWPPALPARAQQLLDEVTRVSVDTPEERTLIELDHAIAANDPVHHVRRLEQELKPIRRQIRQFDTLPTDDPGHQLVAWAHVERLRERARAIEADIARAETRATLHGWNFRPDPELAAAIERRTAHLAHVALTTGEPAVAELAVALTDVNPSATANDLLEAIRNEVAEHERSGNPQMQRDQTQRLPVGLNDQAAVHAELSM